MDRFKDKADFSDLQVSSSTKVKPSLGHNNEQPLSQTVKRMHQHSPNREHSLNNNNNQTSTCSTNMTLGFAQNDSCDHGNVMDLQASRLYQPEYFLDKNKNESREGDDLSDTNSRRSNRNLFYSAQDSLGETFDQSNIRENTSSTDRQSGRPTERVHKSSIERQDSTTLDIGLGDCAQTQNLLFGEQVSLADSQASAHDLLARLNAHDLLARLNATNGSFKHPLEGAQDKTCHKYQFLHGGPDTSPTSKQIMDYSQSFPGRPGARDDETEPSTTGQNILRSCRECPHSLAYGLGKAGSSQNVDGLSNEGSKTWSWHSVNKKDVAMFVVIGLLAFGVFHLHGRVEAVERGLVRECSCSKDAEISKSGATSSGLHSGPDAVLKQTLPGLGNGQQESASTNGATQTNVLTKYFNTRNSGKLTETNLSSNEHRPNISPAHNPLIDQLETTETDRETQLAKWEAQRTDVFKKPVNISSIAEETVRGDGHGHSSIDDVRLRGRLRRSRDTARTHSRSIRSIKKEHDPETFYAVQNGGEEGGAEGDKMEIKSNFEVYEARFYTLFPYSSTLIEKDCAEHPDWNKSIQGCRDKTVTLQHKYSTLPFYTATKQTASKAPSQRLMTIKKDKPGEFVVKIPGDYLVQLNIVIVVEDHHHHQNNKHFLAIYLNGQATLACHEGGFRCPHTNHDHLNKYKICNIIGMLHLNKNDTLDIRTMEKNMTVRMAKSHNTFLRVLLVNKSS